MRKSLSATMALGLSCAAMFSLAAHAQQVGTYSGTTADGDPISITVGIDPNNSSFQVQGMNVDFSAPCKGAGAGYTLNTAWGFGVAQDIVRGRARVLADDNYFNIQAVLTFPDSADITGTIDTRS